MSVPLAVQEMLVQDKDPDDTLPRKSHHYFDRDKWFAAVMADDSDI